MPSNDDEYSRISAAEEDIKRRLLEEDKTGWLSRRSGSPLVEEWTDALRNFGPGDQLSGTDAVRCQQLLHLYRAYESDLEELADELNTGYVGDLSAGETAFVALIRDMQRRAGELINMNDKAFAALRDGNYTVARALRSDELEQVTTAKQNQLTPTPKPDQAEEITRSLEQTNQLVFYGPPGTGKTYTARRFAQWWISEDELETYESQIHTVTFHPSYSYEDFIEGLTAETGSNGTIEYNVKSGAFKRITRAAYDDYVAAVDGEKDRDPRKYVLIIDEINRGDLTQIFGEIITLLESDKRLDQAEEISVELSYSGNQFVVPPNLYIIGTMNTADRSIALVDAALRRRFDFIPMPPQYDLLLDTYGFENEDHALKTAESSIDPFRVGLSLSILALEKFNSKIINTPDLGKGKQLGHAYLMNITTPTELVHTWKTDLLPLLEEYYFGKISQLRSDLFFGHGDSLIDWEKEQIRSFGLDNLCEEFSKILDIDIESEAIKAASRTELAPLLEEDLVKSGDRLRLNDTALPETIFEDQSEDFLTATVEMADSPVLRWEKGGTRYQPYSLVRNLLEKNNKSPATVDGAECWIISSQNSTLAEAWQAYTSHQT